MSEIANFACIVSKLIVTQWKGATKHSCCEISPMNFLLILTCFHKEKTPQLFHGNLLCLKAFSLLVLRVSINPFIKTLSGLIHGLGKLLLPVTGPAFLRSSSGL